MSYNGWTNYETWAVALWIDNEQGTYHERRSMAQNAWDEADNDPGDAMTIYTKALQNWVEDMVPDNMGAWLMGDLLRSALQEIDWNQIAAAWLEEDKPEEDEDPQDEDEETATSKDPETISLQEPPDSDSLAP